MIELNLMGGGLIPTSSEYALVIAEKPDAAKRIAYALGPVHTRRINGLEVFEIEKAFDSKR